MKTLRKAFVFVLFLSVLSLANFPGLAFGDWKCPCERSTDPDDPPGTKICIGTPEEGSGCNCNAYCNDNGGGNQQ